MSFVKRHDVLLQNENPTARQRGAADPAASVWVSASAGTGKTKVLTDRTLRLLLPRPDGQRGSEPHRILCLTYTKAAASEMALRIGRTLSAWATIDDEKLDEALYELLGRPANDAETQAARRLFARVVDAPGGLKIMTIHSFCQSVLGRFPLEAGLTPHFTTLEDADARALLTRARDAVLTTAQQRPDTPEGAALVRLAAEQTEEQFSHLLKTITAERHQLEGIVRRLETAEGFYAALCAALSIAPGDTEESVYAAVCDEAGFDADALWAACRHLATGLKTDQERGIKMQAWLELDRAGRIQNFESWQRAFLTKDKQPFKKMMTNALQQAEPALDDALYMEADRIVQAIDHLNACRSARLTHDLVILGRAIAAEYQALKDRQAALDFDDLIQRTLKLLQQSDMARWVLFKLDGGLDHILIDEAQDTNPEQWQIVEALTEEFFAGAGGRDDIRTLFTVGDEKQSIYSFQRAAPEKFAAQRLHYKTKVEAAALQWADVPLNTSFRSAPAVLDFVDAVFDPPAAKHGLGEAPVRHLSYRHGHAGLVELWPLFKVAPPDKSDPWQPARAIRSSRKAAALLAGHMAETIGDWIKNGEMLPSRGRPIQAGDILILVRRRSAFVGHLIRALKKHNVAVSGVDRMVLNDQLPVQDLLSVAQAALLPEDDLSLACVLKSPFIGFDDARLEALALSRQSGETLWDALRGSHEQTALAWMQKQIGHAGTDHPYEFFSRLLQSPCPGDATSGLHAIDARMGDEALDPLNEFLNRAMAFERTSIAALQLFLLAQTQGQTEIKREQEEAGGKVRIMTVHASKGLQAPVVFLPDTVPGRNAMQNRLLWPDKTKLDVPLWSPRKDNDSGAYRAALAAVEDREAQEYRRLLYVAMTRAEDRLYIAGYEGRNAVPDDSWYKLAENAFGLFPEAQTVDAPVPDEVEADAWPIRRLTNGQNAAPKADSGADAAIPLPDDPRAAWPWAHRPAPAEPQPPRPLTPSRPSEPEPAARSPLDPADTYRFRRGLLTHRLLQTLPLLPDAVREDAALRFAALPAHDLPPEVQRQIVAETLAVLRHPDFAPLFGPGSQAEVPVTGYVNGQMVSGQIDRLLVTGDSLWIVDYKTNRPPPRDAGGIPAAYRRQLKAYADTLREIYPGRLIRTFLLWTDGARLMEVSGAPDAHMSKELKG
jgi:ATP-dependent helicase/nuclease subunit A